MKAAVFHKVRDVRYEDVPDAVLKHPRDAVVRVTSTAICGSDLHIYNGYFPQLTRLTMGHEFVGIVEDVGEEVSNLKKGDRVIVPSTLACGHCKFCLKQALESCRELDGKMGFDCIIAGGQAEAVRVPYADYGPRKIPEGLTDEQVLFLTDILPTGWAGIDWAGVKGGETVVVFGCGPVGLMAQKAAWIRGAKRVIGIDLLPYRLNLARLLCGSEVINGDDEDVADKILEMTDGIGADVCVDAVGMEADRGWLEKISNVINLQIGSIKVLKTALTAVRRGGVISILGVYRSNYEQFPLGQMFDKGISLRTGIVPIHSYMDLLLDLISTGRIRSDDIITHPLKLEDATHAYRIFNDKEDGCVKVVMTP